MRLLSYTLTAALSLGSLAAQNRSIEFEHGSWAETKAKAKAANKLVFVDAYATWCGPCKWMAKNIFTQDAVADFYNANFINAKLDVEAGDGIEFAKEYGVSAMPTFFFIDGEGKRVHVSVGGMQAEEFIQMGKDAVNPANRIEIMDKKYAAGERSPEFLTSYLKKLNDLGETETAAKISDDYFGSLKTEDLLKEQNWTLFSQMKSDWNSATAKAFRSNYEQFAKTFGTEAVDAKLQEMIAARLESISTLDSFEPKYAELRKQVAALPEAYGNRDKMLLQLDIMSAEIQGNELAMYQGIANFADKYLTDSPSEMNELAWKFFEAVKDEALLKRAMGWAKQSFEADPQHYAADTYAHLAYAVGDKKTAVEWERKAIEMAKKAGADASTYEAALKSYK